MLKTMLKRYSKLVSDKRFSEIFTGSVWALSARVVSTALGLSISIFVARYYGADMIGIIAIINSFLMLATAFSVLGTDTSTLRLIPEHLVKYSPASAFKLYRKTQYLVISISLFTGVVFFLASDFLAEKMFSKQHLSFFLALASIFIVFKSLMVLNTQAVRGLRLIRLFALMQVLPQIFTIVLLGILGIWLSAGNIPVYAVLGGAALTGILGWAIMEFNFKKLMQPDDIVQNMPVKEILFISLPMLLTNTMVFVIGQTGVIMLGMFRPEADVGHYSIAVKLATLTAFIYNAINTIVAPKISELYHSNKMEELFYVAKKSAKLIFWTSAPLLIGLLIFGKTVLNFFWGSDFTAAYLSLIVLLLGQFVHAISGANSILMNMAGYHSQYSKIMLCAAIINLILNILLIPSFGLIGAAISTMITLVGWNITTLIYIKLEFGRTTGYLPGLSLK